MSSQTHKIMVLLLVFSLSAFAHHEKKAKAMERIQTLKKMKLIEHLDLDEAAAEKFFIKYNRLESELQAKMKEMDQVVHKLDIELKADNPNQAEVNKLTENLLKLQNELHELNMKKFREVKPLLTDAQYAKYLVFEKKFFDELRSRIMDFRDKKGRHKGRGDRGSD